MKQKKLFDIPAQVKPKPKITCRSCIHRYKHQYGQMFYCGIQRQRGTAYGDKKIKANDAACRLYKSRVPKFKPQNNE